MALRAYSQNAPTLSEPQLPGGFPRLPESIEKRFPEVATYHEETERFWRRVRSAVGNNAEDVSRGIAAVDRGVGNLSETLRTDFATLSASIATEAFTRLTEDSALASRTTTLESQVQTPTTGLLARVTTVETTYATQTFAEAKKTEAISAAAADATAKVLVETTARSDADSALSSRATTLESQVQTPSTGLLARVSTIETTYATDSEVTASVSSVTSAYLAADAKKIMVQGTAPVSPLANDLWIDTSDNNKAKFWDGAAWQYKQDGVLAAAVSTEASARATADGFLSGKYSIKVIAGNIVTGMNITSSTGTGTDISDVTFQASSFKIYNDTTGIAPFQVIGGVVRVSALSIVAGDVSGLAATATSSDFSAVTGATKPANNADVTLTAINGGLSITGGGLILSSTAMIRAGQSNYNTGTGFFLGMHSGVPKFSVGDPAGNYLIWDGSTLSIKGSLTLVNTISAGSVTGLAATATSSDFSAVTGATKPANNADVTLTAINGGLSVTGGGLILSSTAMIRAGQTDYNTGTGFFLGMNGGTPKFSVGVSSGNYLTWDGSALSIKGSITLVNTIAASSVTGLAATATSSDYTAITGTKPPSNADVTLTAINGGLTVTGGGITLSAGGAIKGGASNFSTGTGFFLGYEGGQYKFRVGTPGGNRIEWDGSTWTVSGITATAAQAPDPTLSAGSAFNIDVDAPGGAPSGYMVFYKIGSGSVQQAGSFPFSVSMANGTEAFEIWAGAPGYTQSNTTSTIWNDL